jgi:hypothetical protein
MGMLYPSPIAAIRTLILVYHVTKSFGFTQKLVELSKKCMIVSKVLIILSSFKHPLTRNAISYTHCGSTLILAQILQSRFADFGPRF